MESSAAGLNLDAQPADFTDDVSRIGSAVTGSTGFIGRLYKLREIVEMRTSGNSLISDAALPWI
jgi:hypothetical protein